MPVSGGGKGPPATSPKNSLLSAISSGAGTLRKLDATAIQKPAPTPDAGAALVDTLANAMAARRGAIQDDPEQGDDWSDDEDWMD